MKPTSILLEALIADLNQCASNDRFFDAFRLLGGDQIAALIRGELFRGTAKIELDRGLVRISLGCHGRKRIKIDVPLLRTPPASPAAKAFNDLFKKTEEGQG